MKLLCHKKAFYFMVMFEADGSSGMHGYLGSTNLKCKADTREISWQASTCAIAFAAHHILCFLLLSLLAE